MRHFFLGDRLLFAIVGSAPTSAQVKQFVIDCFDVDLTEGYANTETGSGSVTDDNIINRATVLDYVLRDVPELGYSTRDMPYPRGELCFKSVHQIRGYYRDPEATAALTTEDGYIITGDIVEQRGPEEVVLIDRRKDVLKLSQAEYVAVGPLGALFEAGAPVVAQMYLYGNSHRPYLLAVVVPDAEVVAAELGSAASEDAIRALVGRDLRRVAADRGLKTFEVPRDVILELEPFSQHNGLLSGVRKLLRPALERKYGARLEAIYEAHDRARRSELSTVMDPACALRVPERLARLLAIHLGLEHVDPASALTYGDLGGDSLGAVELSLLIADAFAVDVPADRILGPIGTVPRLAAEIATQVADGTKRRPTFAGVHGDGATVLHTKHLTLERFIDPAVLAAAPGLPVAGGPPRVVFVTGANGFLGREVCLQWMERVATHGGRVVCLVRAADAGAARARLTRAYADVSEAYLARFEALAGEHLEVVAGDVGQPGLGLDPTTWENLASQVDRISHGAALVNHRLGYAHLFAPNVAGTAEIIRLAAGGRRTPIDFVSSLGVLPLLDATASDDESGPPASSVPLVDDTYAGGYTVSKWAAEHLLHLTASQLSIPVTILRGPMMLPHRDATGVINTSDLFTRLLYSIVVTGIAPRSFYRPAADPRAAHYDGVPVDVVAAAVVAAADLTGDGCRGVNMSNHHVGDGASLDAVVDWIESAGYRVERVEDHGDWLVRFRTALDALPADRKAASAREVLGAYARPQEPSGGVGTTSQFRELMRHVDGGEVPHLDEAYLHKCLADLRYVGLLPDPA